MDEERVVPIPEEDKKVPEAPAPEGEPQAQDTKAPKKNRSAFVQWLLNPTRIFRGIILLALIVALIFLGLYIKSCREKNKNAGKITIDEIEFRIKEVLHTARLNTAEYMYKGVVNWFVEEESGKQTKVGFIKYAGKIKYGVEFDEIDVKLDEKKNVIVITVPPLVREPFVENPECIFLNQSMRMKYNDSKYMNLMRQACMDHIIFNAEKDDAMEAAAEKYTIELVDSLTSPFFTTETDVSYEIRLED